MHQPARRAQRVPARQVLGQRQVARVAVAAEGGAQAPAAPCRARRAPSSSRCRSRHTEKNSPPTASANSARPGSSVISGGQASCSRAAACRSPHSHDSAGAVKKPDQRRREHARSSPAPGGLRVAARRPAGRRRPCSTRHRGEDGAADQVGDEQPAAERAAAPAPPPGPAVAGGGHDQRGGQQDVHERQADAEAEADLPGGDQPAGHRPARPAPLRPVAVPQRPAVAAGQHRQRQRDPADGQDVQVPGLGQPPGRVRERDPGHRRRRSGPRRAAGPARTPRRRRARAPARRGCCSGPRRPRSRSRSCPAGA